MTEWRPDKLARRLPYLQAREAVQASGATRMVASRWRASAAAGRARTGAKRTASPSPPT